MKTIVLLTDFSESSNHAAAYGYHLAKFLQLDVLLCNAIFVPVAVAEAGGFVWSMNGFDGLIEDSHEELKRLKKHFEHTDHSAGFHPQISCVNQTGRLSDVLENVMDICDAEMVVMGTHRKGTGHFFLENNTRNMINSATDPLLLVPPMADLGRLGKIVYATDFSYPEQDIKAIANLVPLASAFSAKILVTKIHTLHEERADHKEGVNRLITKVIAQTCYPDIFYKPIENEQVGIGLSLCCEEEQVDLLVMVHRSHDFVDVILKGSDTQKMAKHTNIPLLVLPGDSSKI
ncbi:universal stress protein [Pedobacter sp. KBW06]|uniref:universal stress protein n=1 Tax=Pedobacter sp. KBW06 TaxID=2153359 RepID=UPI001315441C|nr:universal stress protein [Pedobacter sp. KBW06]